MVSQSLTKASQNTWNKAEDQLRSLVGTWSALGRSWKRYDKAVKHMDRKWLLEDWAYMRSNSKKVKSAKWFAGHALRQICKKRLQLYWMVLQELMDKAADLQLADRHVAKKMMASTWHSWSAGAAAWKSDQWVQRKRLRQVMKKHLAAGWQEWRVCSELVGVRVRSYKKATSKWRKKWRKKAVVAREEAKCWSSIIGLKMASKKTVHGCLLTWVTLLGINNTARDASAEGVEHFQKGVQAEGDEQCRNFLLPLRDAARRRKVSLMWLSARCPLPETIDHWRKFAAARNETKELCENVSSRLLRVDGGDAMEFWQQFVQHKDKERAVMAKLERLGMATAKPAAKTNAANSDSSDGDASSDGDLSSDDDDDSD